MEKLSSSINIRVSWVNNENSFILHKNIVQLLQFRDVTARATITTMIAPKLSDVLTLFQPGVGWGVGGRFCTNNFPMFTSLNYGPPHLPRVHVIKATQYTRLKATTKNTGKKATKIYRNIGYNEYTGLKATAFLNTQEKGYTFWIYRKKGYTL